ncbi:uncharacterized protein [Neodiprion pinetum]|uniref:uncharacterized protein n=1 Tax=Neodiprion pinetum TaxID=441929 RepID=UPI001EDEAC2B|nr:uncharacterized protein LOC124213644 isoform X1 [Neodiprion pinetum]
MSTYRTPHSGLATVLAISLIFINSSFASFSTASNGHSVNATVPLRSSHKLPSLTFRGIEGSENARHLTMRRQAFPNQRGNQQVLNGTKYVSRQMPFSTRRTDNYKVKHATNINNEQANNVNAYSYVETSITHLDNTGYQTPGIYNQLVQPSSSMANLEIKLYGSVLFRINMNRVFGHILAVEKNLLTVNQHASLDLIMKTLALKQAYVFDVLKIFKQLQYSDRKAQFRMVLVALAYNVSPYVYCACKYWVDEIDGDRVDIYQLTAGIKEPSIFLAGIEASVIETCASTDAIVEQNPFGKMSVDVKQSLGPIFVSIFHKLKTREVILSQRIFGAILMNLPLGYLDPALEEYVEYIWIAAQQNSIQHWNDVASKVQYDSPVELVISVTKYLLRHGDTSSDLKRPLRYLLLHLRRASTTYPEEYSADMQVLFNNDGDLRKLFWMIQDDVIIPELIELRDLLIEYTKNVNISNMVEGMSKHIYRKPLDLLIAVLVRIQGRIQREDIKDLVTKLLSILTVEKELYPLSLTVPANVDLLILLNFLYVPNNSPEISALGKKIQDYLEQNLELLEDLSQLISKVDKTMCHRPVQCLVYVLVEIIHPSTVQRLRVPSTLILMIKKLLFVIRDTVSSDNENNVYDVLSFEVFIIIHILTGVDLEWNSEEPDLEKPGISIPPDYVDESENFTQQIIPSIRPPIELELPDFGPKPEFDPHPDFSPKPDFDQHPDFSPKPDFDPHPDTGPNPDFDPYPDYGPKPDFDPTLKPIDATDELPEELAHVPILPPNIDFETPFCVIFPKGDAPPYISPNEPSDKNDTGIVLEFPPITVLLQNFDPNTNFHPNELPEVPNISKPLQLMFGINYVKAILGKVDKAKYPTVISLLYDLLNHALTDWKVMTNPKLVSTIKAYLKAIDYLSATALLTIVVKYRKITSDVLYITFNPENPKDNNVDSRPPQKTPTGFMVLPVYHPKYLLQHVDPVDPYGTLIPKFEEGEDNPIEELINDGSLQEILGPQFNPLSSPNKATLLVVVLHKLIESNRVKFKPRLLKKLTAYLLSIKTVAMFTKMSDDYTYHLVELQPDPGINWQPETISLIVALPPGRNQDELNKLWIIKAFLAIPNLIDLLEIGTVPYSITRGELLKMIFKAAIWGNKISLDDETLDALKYYENKIMTNGFGALPVGWVWMEMIIISEEIPLGEIIEALLDYNNLPFDVPHAYNDVIKYLLENPYLLQSDDDFAFEQYHTKGSFLKGLFTHFLRVPDLDPNFKSQVRRLIPYIKQTGPGSERMNYATNDR